MIPSGLFTQIALIALSVGIIFTYIEPAFQEISQSQEQISVYQLERGKVAAVNSSLEQKLGIIESVFQTDREKLLSYMPDLVDPLVVMRDLQTMSEGAGLIISDIVDGGSVEDTEQIVDIYGTYDPYALASSQKGPYAYSFSLSVEGSYGQIKRLIETLEKNNYPLEIQSLGMQAADGGFIAAEMILYSYSQKSNEPEEVTLFQDVNVIYE